MQANATVVNAHEIPNPTDLLDALKQWARRNLTKDRSAEASLALGALVSLSYLAFTILQGMQNYTTYAY